MAWDSLLNQLEKDIHLSFKLPAVYKPKSGGQFSTEVNLRSKETEVDNGNGGTIYTEMTEAVFDKPQPFAINRGDRFTCRGEEYVITNISDESTLMTSVFTDKL